MVMAMDFSMKPFTFFVLLLYVSSTATARDLVRSNCIHARYPNLCIRTLSSTGSVKTQADLARLAISVSLSRTRSVSTLVSNLRSSSRGDQLAIRDCVELLHDSIDQLRRSLLELHQLRGDFRWHMSNAQTWVSSALTDDDTCLDGFSTVHNSVKTMLRRRITGVARVTSNALYLINRLALTKVH